MGGIFGSQGGKHLAMGPGDRGGMTVPGQC